MRASAPRGSVDRESIGQLPVHVYETDNDGATNRAPDHPACVLLNDAANDWTPASKFREEITRDALLYPNGGFAYINFVDGKPFELTRFDPEINPVIVEYIDSEPFYRVGDREIPRKNMLHIPSPALHYWGLVHDARDPIGLCLVMERYASRLFGNSARPSGILSLGGKPGPADIAKAAAAWNATHGGDKSGGTAVIPVRSEMAVADIHVSRRAIPGASQKSGQRNRPRVRRSAAHALRNGQGHQIQRGTDGPRVCQLLPDELDQTLGRRNAV